jgi:type II secretory pathway component PulJ
MTGQQGYTATEALAALAILGLAVGGLTAGLHVLGREQSAAGSALKHAASLRSGTQQLPA